MKQLTWYFTCGCLALISGTALPTASAQVVPTTPKKFQTRPIGGSGSTGGATINPSTAPKMARYTSHFTLTESRDWTSTEGKVITGKLAAFEDIVVEAPQGEPPSAPAPPDHPTVVRDGKVRLIINNKATVVALERLSQADRDLIAKISEAHAAASEKKSPAP